MKHVCLFVNRWDFFFSYVYLSFAGANHNLAVCVRKSMAKELCVVWINGRYTPTHVPYIHLCINAHISGSRWQYNDNSFSHRLNWKRWSGNNLKIDLPFPNRQTLFSSIWNTCAHLCVSLPFRVCVCVCVCVHDVHALFMPRQWKRCRFLCVCVASRFVHFSFSFSFLHL